MRSMKKGTTRALPRDLCILYEGDELIKASMDRIWAAGATPLDAVRALCEARGLGMLGPGGGGITPLRAGESGKYTWGCKFEAAAPWASGDGWRMGTNVLTAYRAAGVHVPGGVILTWWMRQDFTRRRT
jgi:hypothetical protein